MKPSTPVEKNKRMTAIHEAGHAVVACMLGGKHVQAFIYPTHTDRPDVENKWIGECVDWGLSGIGYSALGFAGGAAEAIESGVLHDQYVFNRMSDEDIEFVMGSEPFEGLTMALGILKHMWPAVEEIAAILFEREAAFDDVIEDIVERVMTANPVAPPSPLEGMGEDEIQVYRESVAELLRERIVKSTTTIQ